MEKQACKGNSFRRLAGSSSVLSVMRCQLSWRQLVYMILEFRGGVWAADLNLGV